MRVAVHYYDCKINMIRLYLRVSPVGLTLNIALTKTIENT